MGIFLCSNQHLPAFLFHLCDILFFQMQLFGHELTLLAYLNVLVPQVNHLLHLALELLRKLCSGGVLRQDHLVL